MNSLSDGGDDRKIVTAILVAAGSGERLGAGEPKALVRVGGTTLLEFALRSVFDCERIGEVIVAAPPGKVTEVSRLCQQESDRYAERNQDCSPGALTILAGGATRSESVAVALKAVSDRAHHLLVHDVARPFVTVEVIDRVLDALDAGAAAVIPVRPVTDTIKRVEGDVVVATVDREELRAVQTPQGFQRDVLISAHASGESATDDASLVEMLGIAVTIVDGADEAFKITYPWDLAVAQAFVEHMKTEKN